MAENPTLRLTWAQFKALPEYSMSLPTGTTTGKRWRRHHQFRDNEAARAAYPDRKHLTEKEWLPFIKTKFWVGEYGQPEEKGVPIIWYRPVIICRSGEGLADG